MAKRKDTLINVDIPDMDDVIRRMKGMEDKAPLAMARAINRTLTFCSKKMGQEAKKRYIVKAGAVKKTLKFYKAKKSNLTGAVISSSKSKVPLIKFKVDPMERPITIAKYTISPSVYMGKIRKGRGAKMSPLDGSKDRSKGFYAVMPSGHTGIFQRRMNDSKEELAELYGHAVASMVSGNELAYRVNKEAAEYLHERLEHEIDYIMGR